MESRDRRASWGISGVVPSKDHMDFTIEDLTGTDSTRIDEVARLLHVAFSPLGVWTTMAEARQEVVESLSADRVSRVARAHDGAIIG